MGPTLTPTCYGPPPLPPKKVIRTVAMVNPMISGEAPKSPVKSRHPEKPPVSGDKSTFGNHLKMSSTYRSFRDPVEENEIVVIAAEPLPANPFELKPILKKKEKKKRNKSTGFESGSLTRAWGSGRYTRKTSLLTRSHSDSNLNKNFGDPDIHCPTYEDSNLTRYLKTLNGSWKNLLNFGGMNRQPKPTPQMKKVAPPAVPDSAFRHSGSSFGSAGYGSAGEESVFHDPASRDGYDMTDCYGPAGKSPGSQFNYPQFTFPGPGQTYAQINPAKAAAHYHQLALQEDQGIDMTQSPGRDSPGSSGSRHSTASLDSGRASSSGSHLMGAPHHPRCSISSSSVGSTEHGAPARVERLLLQGVPDQDVLHSWLMDLHFEEYFPLFINAGYDMSTISRMTPEDLTAIGIKKPNHRKKLKAEIAQLTISDGLPDYIPGSLDEWLRLLRLEEYGPALGCQGYETIQDVTQLTWEDLEDIGIVKLGHQKRLMLAIKRVKDLKAGKVFPPIYGNTIHAQVTVESPSSGILANNMSNIPPDCECPRVHTSFKSFHQPWEIEATRNLYYTTDIIPIQIRGGRGKSLESLEDGLNNQRTLGGGTSSFTQLPAGWRRSYDDGDITPTNETVMVPFHEGGGTLPRPKGLVRPRPIAKIPATFVPNYRNEEICMNTLKRRPPSPPKRQCESVTVIADLHCSPYPPPPAPASPLSTNYNSLTPSFKANGSDASFKSSSSTESDSLPFANENAGTIKQRANRPGTEYAPSMLLQSKERTVSLSSSLTNTLNSSLNNSLNSSHNSPRKLEQEPSDVLNDIGNMLANLTDELDAMLEEEKRQNLTNA